MWPCRCAGNSLNGEISWEICRNPFGVWPLDFGFRSSERRLARSNNGQVISTERGGIGNVYEKGRNNGADIWGRAGPLDGRWGTCWGVSAEGSPGVARAEGPLEWPPPSNGVETPWPMRTRVPVSREGWGAFNGSYVAHPQRLRDDVQ